MVKTITDRNMLELIDRLKTIGLIKYKQDFADSIGITKQSLSGIKNGTRSFTVEQISKACEEYKINVNWVFGFEDTLFRTGEKARKATLKQPI